MHSPVCCVCVWTFVFGDRPLLLVSVLVLPGLTYHSFLSSLLESACHSAKAMDIRRAKCSASAVAALSFRLEHVSAIESFVFHPMNCFCT